MILVIRRQPIQGGDGLQRLSYNEARLFEEQIQRGVESVEEFAHIIQAVDKASDVCFITFLYDSDQVVSADFVLKVDALVCYCEEPFARAFFLLLLLEDFVS